MLTKNFHWFLGIVSVVLSGSYNHFAFNGDLEVKAVFTVTDSTTWKFLTQI